MITLDSYKYLKRGISNKYSEKKVKSEWDSISITVSIIYSIRSSQKLCFKSMHRQITDVAV